MLARIGAPPDVRLACQTRPTARSRRDAADAGYGWTRGRCAERDGPGHGVEREIAVLFADLRGFTRLSEGRLPYDTVFILNRYFKAMGEAIEGAGGRVDKFIGDGIMALFGLESGAGRGGAGGARRGARHGPGAGPCSTASSRSSSTSRCAWASACIWAR